MVDEPAGLPADFEAFQQHMSALFAPEDVLQFEAYPKPWDKRGPMRRFTIERRNVGQILAEMKRLNNAPHYANWYVRTNPLRKDADPGRSAGEKAIGTARALHLDIDGATPEQVLVQLDRMGWPQPHVVVRSGGVGRPGNTGAQVWYLLAESIELDNVTIQRIKPVIRAMLKAVGGDEGTENVSRLMRPAGFWNVKYPGEHEPRPAELVVCEPEHERWTLDQWSKLVGPIGEVEKKSKAARPKAGGKAVLPGDDYNARGDVREVLEKHGWALTIEGENEHWARPGKEGGTSATFKDLVFWVFTSNAPPFEANKGYSPFSVYTLLECEGDYRRAAEELRGRGYGRRRITTGTDGALDVDAACKKLEEFAEQAQDEPAVAIQTLLGDQERVKTLALVYWQRPAAVAAVLMRLEAAGGKAKHVNELRECLRKEGERLERTARALEQAEKRRTEPVKQALEDAPISAAAMVPSGWQLGPGGIAEEKISRNTGELFAEYKASTPLIITGRTKDLETGHISLALAWRYGTRWGHKILARKAAMQANDIINELADVGVDVHAQNKINVIKWLSDFEFANTEVLPLIAATTHMGWVSGPRFVCGHTIISKDGAQPLAEAEGASWQNGAVAFRSKSDGDQDVVDAYTTGGTLAGWLEAVRPVAGYPRVQIGIYAALAAPLLRILKTSSFIVEFADPSSSGKTKALAVAASTCGCPTDRAPKTAVYDWGATRVFIDNTLAILQNLPFFLDDTRKAKEPRDIPQIIYLISGGHARGLGATQRGVQAGASWNTIVFSTGESKITDFGEEQGGTHARVLCVWGPPWKEVSKTAAELVTKVQRGIDEHYGHALPLIVRHAIQNREHWPEWRQWKEQSQSEYVDRFLECTKGQGVQYAHRLAEYVAVLETVASIAHQVLDLPWDKPDFWEVLSPSLLEGVAGADRALVALQIMIDDANARADQYYDAGNTLVEGYAPDPKDPYGGWRGRWDRGRQYWEYIAFIGDTMREVLSRHNIRTSVAVRWWKDRGWLIRDERDNKNAKVTPMGGERRTRMYQVKREAVELVVPPSAESKEKSDYVEPRAQTS